MKRDLISILDVQDDILAILERGRAIKTQLKAADAGKKTRTVVAPDALNGKTLGMIFEKPSTRTRVSFEVGMNKLGGNAIFLSAQDMQLGRGECIEDTALVLSRYVDAIAYRAFSHDMVVELARHATVPVINALDEKEHPCQILADFLTILEKKERLDGLHFLYIGDGNNMCHSYLLGAPLVGMNITAITPSAYAPDASVVRTAKKLARERGSSVTVSHSIDRMPSNADVVATDTWVSIGQEKEKAQRVEAFKGYTITEDVMARAHPDALFMHCLPAYYGYEVTKDVAHGPQSVIFDEAENRLWAQLAAVLTLLGI